MFGVVVGGCCWRCALLLPYVIFYVCTAFAIRFVFLSVQLLITEVFNVCMRCCPSFLLLLYAFISRLSKKLLYTFPSTTLIIVPLSHNPPHIAACPSRIIPPATFPMPLLNPIFLSPLPTFLSRPLPSFLTSLYLAPSLCLPIPTFIINRIN